MKNFRFYAESRKDCLFKVVWTPHLTFFGELVDQLTYLEVENSLAVKLKTVISAHFKHARSAI